MTRPAYTTVGTVSYNGYTFKDPLRSKLTGTPIRDAADRTTKYVHYVLEIEAYVFPDDDIVDYFSGAVTTGTANTPTDPQVTDLRSKLSRTGGWLVATGLGFGNDININLPGSLSSRMDVAFGPKPTILAWTCIGSDRAAKILWTCEFTIPECPGGAGYYQDRHGFAAFTYQVAWHTSREGTTVRTTSGEINIANGRINTGAHRNIRDSADVYRERISVEFPPIVGFHREQTYQLSDDKSTLRFILTDSEIPSDYAYPTYIVSIDVTHDVSSRNVGSGENNVDILNGVTWNNSIRGSIVVAPGFPKALAWEAFRQIVAGRAGIISIQGKTKVNTAQFITTLSISNSLFNRKIQFEIGFFLVATLETFMDLSGVFTPVAGTDWQLWTASIADAGISNPRSIANLGHLPTDDYIIDLCIPIPGGSSGTVPANKPYSDGFAFLSESQPSPEESWIWFENHIMWEEEQNGVYIHKRFIQGEETYDQAQIQEWLQDGDLRGIVGNITGSWDLAPKTPPPQSLGDTVQIRAAPKYRITMFGYGRRRCFDVPVPRLVSFGGVIPVRKSRKVTPGVELYHPVYPIKYCSWMLVYELTSPPDFTIKDDIIVQHDGKFGVTQLDPS